ncbi:MAG: type IV pilus modification protein PilV [Mariprofundales bacterium]
MKHESGFSLVEALVAMVIISVGLLAITKFSINIMTFDAQARERAEATHIATQILEDWIALNALQNNRTPPASYGFSNTASTTATSFTSSNFPSTSLNIKYQLSATLVALTDQGTQGVNTLNPQKIIQNNILVTRIPYLRKVSVSWSPKDKTSTSTVQLATIR